MQTTTKLLLLIISTLSSSFALGSNEVSLDRTKGSYAWKIKKDQWDAQDEAGYGNFVRQLGEAVAARKCRNVTACMRSSSNPYWNSDPQDLLIKADCADWTYLLRAYYAWKNQLPFAFTIMRPHPSNPSQGHDMRYTPNGNVVSERVDMTSNFWGYADAKQLFTEFIPRLISTANTRTNQPTVAGNLWSDFYPINIDRESLRPGTTIYDPFGHVVVVYKITDDGQVHYVDAHTDNNLTVAVFNEKFARTAPQVGGGFKNWRPIKLVGYSRDSSGYLSGGRIIPMSNTQISDYSEVQYYGNQSPQNRNWDQARFNNGSKDLNFYEYVRAKMSAGNSRLNPLSEMRDRLAELCQTTQARVRSVESARTEGIYRKPHPAKLPFNIYVTDGDWETYSSPSRDAVIRILFSTLVTKTKEWVQIAKSSRSALDYSGTNLAKDLLNIYQEETERCGIIYYNSLGQRQMLNLDDIRERLPKISFDAYHCPELRWGATPDTAEGRTCSTDQEKNFWYQQEQGLRNQTERRLDVRMDYGARDLSVMRQGVGTATVPETNIPGFLHSMLR